ncbi:MAG TPA: cbb3-type cytochrome c oxidase subunit I, partial [Myxococcota bacterium]|nr:cbb3-type cytochrome c oxidase subunit I [Myxococcota bacterium]
MTSVTVPPADVEAPGGARGWALLSAWACTRDHKKIGIMFFFATAAALALGGLFALVLRLELLTPEGDVVSAASYNRLFTLHGVTMVWLFMI